MFITKQTDYAVLLMTRLAELTDSSEPLSLMKFADEEQISFYFLQRIARKLKHAKLIKGVEGRKGGYFLSKSAAETTLGSIIRALEGSFRISDCAQESLKHKPCKREATCRTKKVWLQFKNQTVAYFDKISLQHVLDNALPDW
ncbi:MAG TPA: Rrf2 family transcriptional regulator [bacterium]|nr:Rrf2 family transcriptional regulator [bacterium]